MRARIAFLALLLCGFAAMPLYAGFSNCYTRIVPQPDLSMITVSGRCTFTTFGYPDTSVTIRGEMTVTPADLYTSRTACKGTPYCGMTLKPPYVASTTYTSNAKFEASQWYAVFDTFEASDTATTPDPVNPNSTCPLCCKVSPIVISTRGDYHLTSVQDGVIFDIDGDGDAEPVSWTTAGSDLAFLALDRNRNGSIDGGRELFGDAIAENGWVALAELDANGDGVMNSNDAAWRELVLWYDRDHDGQSDVGELVPIASSSVTAIDTAHRWSGRRDAFGNLFRYAAPITFVHGRREAYDVYLLAAN